MECRYCEGECIKRGKRKGVQKYSCNLCHKYQQKDYKNTLLTKEEEKRIRQYNAERVSFRGMARILNCSAATIQRKILKLSKGVNLPWRSEICEEYEIDEICCYTTREKKESNIWLTYAINRKSKSIISYSIGRRNNATMIDAILPVLNLHPKRVYTDKYPVYKSIIPKDVLSNQSRKTNTIERMNLTIRNRISRFSRRTLSFPKSLRMTNACVLLFFQTINWQFKLI